MGDVRVRFLGSGDAFGSGGRFQTCILVDAPETRFLIDCGASSLIAMRHFGVAPDSIDMVLLTHLHGDHFGGLPFLILDAQLVSRRSRPLLIAGPPGTRVRLHAAMEVFFPGSAAAKRKFETQVTELEPERPRELGPVTVTPYPARHFAGDPCYHLRVEVAGRTVTYSGDTGWSEALIPASRDADLLISECFFYDKEIDFHMNYRRFMANRGRLGARRIVLTHLGEEMMARHSELEGEFAEDGLSIEL